MGAVQRSRPLPLGFLKDGVYGSGGSSWCYSLLCGAASCSAPCSGALRPEAGVKTAGGMDLMQETPKSLDKKRADEKLLVSEMIALYCRKQHKTPKGQLCPACQELQDYALARIDKCPFMETKTFCSACKVHCYKPAMREQIRAVMRWAGPRMLPVHPVLSVKHVAVTLKAKWEAQKTDA
jgi:hypothetical protein